MTSAVHDVPAIPPVRAARILIVDDEETIRMVLARFLRARGYDVSVAESGHAALDLLESATFDLVLCDVRMPGLSGTEVVPRILEIAPQVGIVMLSAVNDAPTATQAMSHGVLDYLTKPIELKQLHDAVERALGRLRARRELDDAAAAGVVTALLAALSSRGLLREDVSTAQALEWLR